MPAPRVTRSPFGTTPAGEAVDLFTCTNTHGLTVRAMTRGATIVSIEAPDREGRSGNVVLGHDTLEGYLRETTYRGAIVGRVAGRIAHGRFTLDGTTYRLAVNEPPHHLHGGDRGFDQAVWAGAPAEDGSPGVSFRHTSPDGDEGYPGTVEVIVEYRLTDRNELVVEYTAATDAATPLNLTQHTYFNLGDTGDVRDHVLELEADAYVPLDETLIPTGAMAPVAGTRFDLRTPVSLRSRAGESFDHTFVIRRAGPGVVRAAMVREPGSGRTLEVLTTEPGVHLYTGRPEGLTLETQHFADAPNQTGFPSTILYPGSRFRSRTVYVFGVDR